MELNDIVIYKGRRLILVGIDPMSVKPQRAYLRDLKTGEQLPLLYDELMKQVRDASACSQPQGERPRDD